MSPPVSVPPCHTQGVVSVVSGADPDQPVLPQTTRDESDPADSGSDEWRERDHDPDDTERFLREVPPHHG
ncbi:MAG TPA: hypothetical protein DHW34_07195 [Actinobacteria bacterium]|nr:hypothetical protein [Actinomycetota bacterium]HCK79783.1 hypothetical protein [Actinomycetota bacterium]